MSLASVTVYAGPFEKLTSSGRPSVNSGQNKSTQASHPPARSNRLLERSSTKAQSPKTAIKVKGGLGGSSFRHTVQEGLNKVSKVHPELLDAKGVVILREKLEPGEAMRAYTAENLIAVSPRTASEDNKYLFAAALGHELDHVLNPQKGEVLDQQGRIKLKVAVAMEKRAIGKEIDILSAYLEVASKKDREIMQLRINFLKAADGTHNKERYERLGIPFVD